MRHSAEEKIAVVLAGLRGEESIAELCRREGIASSMYYGWSKEFLEVGKRRLAVGTAQPATSDKVKELRREVSDKVFGLSGNDILTSQVTRTQLFGEEHLTGALLN